MSLAKSSDIAAYLTIMSTIVSSCLEHDIIIISIILILITVPFALDCFCSACRIAGSDIRPDDL